MLRVSLLGEQVIADDTTGTVLTRSPRSVALVAHLVVHAGLAQPRRLLAGLFWPDSTDAQALTNLRRELHQLRRVLGDPPSLAVTGRDLCWRDTPSSRVDVREFDLAHQAALAAEDPGAAVAHARTALAAYRGELLPGLADDWVLAARAELDRRCVELCDLICSTPAGDPAAALAAARRRIRLRPLEETGYRTLMGLQADAGDRAGAVSTYHRCASVLERELGVVPAEPTRAALRRLLARPGPEVRRAAATALVGRAAELARLGERWHAAAAGRAGVVLVRGDPGVGKTRLVTELAGLARAEGAVVATGRCFGSAGRLPLAPVADWLRTPALQRATGSLDPLWRAEVARLLPAARPDGGQATLEAWQRPRFFEGLARALTAGGRPVLLVLDNVQWCDEETGAFLAFCLGLLPDAPLLVAATLREGTPAPGVPSWTAQLRDDGRLTELPLGPFDAGGTALLGEAVAGRPLTASDREVLHAATGGYPLFVVEALRAGDAPPTESLGAVLRARLAQPGPAAREVAGLAAAAGRDFTLELLTEASDLDADTVVDAVDELWRRRILREVGGGYDFTHDLLREAAYQQVSPPRRWLLHRRLAQGLELLHADDADAVAAQLAEQYARGGRPDRAVTSYRRAAAVATRTFAHAEAIRLLEAALALVRARPASGTRDRTEHAVLDELAGPLNARHGYSSPQLQQTVERALVLAEAAGDPAATVTALLAVFSSRFVQGRTAQAHEVAERALELLGPDAAAAETGTAHFAYAGSSVSLGRPAAAVRHFALAAARTRDLPRLPVGTRPDVHGPAWAAHAHWLLGDDDAAVASAAEAVARARAVDDPYSLAIGLAYAGVTHQMRRDGPALWAAVSELHALCDRYGFAYYREWALVLGGWSRGGAAGLAAAQEGVANLKAEGSFARMPYWLALVAELAEPAAARATLDAALAAGEARDDRWWLPEVLRLRAAHDADPVPRLRAAAELARAQGSVALRRRAEADLGVRLPS
ncbi:transcriptional activator domain-containing protein [Amycolatopsis pretoriensis]|uniref:Transcriptional activator domain-containing protein n=1 Tax=Amycolatopsis pretoriensis TaxID=218821 RepID=A0A1H5R972_9PSEU|nr:AAA family ATPase [Amycolatopsis pretoriensis]SEF34869.1 transcriptional activator domain-containing protein [Amycolatopsis pretoriensis]